MNIRKFCIDGMIPYFGGAYFQVCFQGVVFLADAEGNFKGCSSLIGYAEAQQHLKLQMIPKKMETNVAAVVEKIQHCLFKGLDVKQYFKNGTEVPKSKKPKAISFNGKNGKDAKPTPVKVLHLGHRAGTLNAKRDFQRRNHP